MLYVVATPIGNLGDISQRALDILASVDYIAAEDTRNTVRLCSHFGIKTKLLSYHKFNEEQRSDKLTDLLSQGISIALVTDAGTPCISDPGYVLIRRARELGLPVTAVPGASALIAALSVSGLCTDSFHFHGFMPATPKHRAELFKKLEEGITQAFYESPQRIAGCLAQIAELYPNATISLHNDLTKLHERVYYGSVGDVLCELKANPKHELGEYVLLLQIPETKAEETEKLSAEALLVDTMAKQGCDIKEAISLLTKQGFRKNELYEGSLRLKQLLS